MKGSLWKPISVGEKANADQKPTHLNTHPTANPTVINVLQKLANILLEGTFALARGARSRELVWQSHLGVKSLLMEFTMCLSTFTSASWPGPGLAFLTSMVYTEACCLLLLSVLASYLISSESTVWIHPLSPVVKTAVDQSYEAAQNLRTCRTPACLLCLAHISLSL